MTRDEVDRLGKVSEMPMSELYRDIEGVMRRFPAGIEAAAIAHILGSRLSTGRTSAALLAMRNRGEARSFERTDGKRGLLWVLP